jgi:hypothetical protein
MSTHESEFDPETAQQRLSALERLEALYRLREQAKGANRAAMLKSIEDLIAMERRALARDLDGEPAG